MSSLLDDPDTLESDFYEQGPLKEDRYGLILTIVLFTLMILLGIFQKNSSSAQVWQFSSREAGIEAYYPAGWLSSETNDYVVLLHDPQAIPYKTQYSISVIPYGPQSTIRNVLDSITIQRAYELSAYRVLNIEEISVGGLSMTQMDFTFVDADPNPFIQRVPVVVQGRDIVTIDGDRAVIVSFMSAQDEFDENLVKFEKFFASLRY